MLSRFQLDRILLIIGLAFIAACSRDSTPVEADSTPVRPPYEWQTSALTAQGLDSNAIAGAVQQVSREPYIFSFLIVKNGYLVLEHYNHDLQKFNDYEIRSVSKAFTAALAPTLSSSYLQP